MSRFFCALAVFKQASSYTSCALIVSSCKPSYVFTVSSYVSFKNLAVTASVRVVVLLNCSLYAASASSISFFAASSALLATSKSSAAFPSNTRACFTFFSSINTNVSTGSGIVSVGSGTVTSCVAIFVVSTGSGVIIVETGRGIVLVGSGTATSCVATFAVSTGSVIIVETGRGIVPVGSGTVIFCVFPFVVSTGVKSFPLSRITFAFAARAASLAFSSGVKLSTWPSNTELTPIICPATLPLTELIPALTVAEKLGIEL